MSGSGKTSDLFQISLDQLERHFRAKGEDEHEILSHLATFSFMRYKESGNRGELDTALKNAELGLQKMPQGHSKHIDRLNNLGIILGYRYRETGQVKDLEKAIRLLQLVVESTPDDDPGRLHALNDLGTWLGLRYAETREIQDLDEAIRVAELADKLTPDGHPDQYMAFNGLGTNLGDRYRRTGQIQDLERAINLGKQAVNLVPDDNGDRVACLCNLGNNLESWYKRTLQMQDLAEAIQVTELALKLTLEGDVNQLLCLDSLGNKLEARYERTGRRQDLDEAIRLAERAVKLTPDNHKGQAGKLCNLGAKLIRRGKLTGQVQDLDEAIRLGELAVKSTPNGSIDRSIHLNNLGHFLESRYELTSQMGDLEEALRVVELAENLSPDDFPDLTRGMKVLKNRLESQREEQMRQMEISSEADRLDLDLLLEKLKRYGIQNEWDEGASMMRVKLTGAVTPADCAEILKLVGGNLQKIEIKNNFEYKGRFNVEDIRKELESMTGPSKLPLGLKTTFEYPRLPKGHVRLLKGILGGSHPMATLENHPLESAPAYTAISYAWGANETTRTVFLNNASFGISVHVLEALNQFSFLVPGSHAIWLDKICINQGDNGEKADQVARMRDIYMQAEEVIIWMGATAHSSDELIENMPAMLDDLRTITPGMTLAASSVSIKLWHALGHFYTRDWFRRLWVVQEALLAKNITVVCGSRHIDWDTLAKLTQNIFEARILPDILPPGLERKDIEPGFSAMLKRNKFRIMKLALSELPLYPFLELLDHARECQVGQPVDRIWAVIGLAPSEIYEAAVPLIDYHPKATTKYWETYINFVRVLLTKDPGLHVLALCSSEASLDELPSWCPNFNSTPACVSRIQGAWRSFRSGQSAKTRAFRKIAFGPDSYTLRVNGFRVDRVDNIVENSAYTKDNAWLNRDFRWVMELERKKAAIRDWERKCLRLARSVYGTPNNVPDAHWRTLILDHIQFPHKRCSGSDRKAYDMFIRWCAGDPTEASGLEDDRSAAYSLSMMVGTVGRPYISTKKGRVGLAPPGTQEGDVICIFYGSPVPYFLRFDESGVARLIGDGFVHGLMYGEALEIDDRGDDELIRVV